MTIKAKQISSSPMTNEEIRDGLNAMGHLGFLDWTFEIAARTQQLVFFSQRQLRSGSGPFSALYPETARTVVAYAASRPREGDIVDEIDQIVFESTGENLSDAAQDEIADLILGLLKGQEGRLLAERAAIMSDRPVVAATTVAELEQRLKER